MNALQMYNCVYVHNKWLSLLFYFYAFASVEAGLPVWDQSISSYEGVWYIKVLTHLWQTWKWWVSDRSIDIIQNGNWTSTLSHAHLLIESTRDVEGPIENVQECVLQSSLVCIHPSNREQNWLHQWSMSVCLPARQPACPPVSLPS